MRQLAVQYEAYFAGGHKRPSADLAWRVDNCFRLLNESTTLKYAQRFRLNQLQQRHAVVTRVWRRKLDIKEGGWRRATDRLLSVSGAHESTEAVPRTAECHIDLGHGAEVDDANIERLYAAYLRARERASDAVPAGTLERFRALIENKAAQIRTQRNDARVAATVTLEDGRVKLRLEAKEEK